MRFLEIAEQRQSCRKYDTTRSVPDEFIHSILHAGQLAPSACNGQPYHFTVCKGAAARAVADATKGPGLNQFVRQAPVMIVISEENYVTSAAFGAKVKKNDYRSIDIGIAAAYLTSQAHTLGLGSCILGWFDDEKVREICHLDQPVRLVICVGYPSAEDKIRPKKRRQIDSLVTEVD